MFQGIWKLKIIYSYHHHFKTPIADMVINDGEDLEIAVNKLLTDWKKSATTLCLM